MKYTNWANTDDAWKSPCVIFCNNCVPTFSWSSRPCSTTDSIYVVCHTGMKTKCKIFKYRNSVSLVICVMSFTGFLLLRACHIEVWDLCDNDFSIVPQFIFAKKLSLITFGEFGPLIPLFHYKLPSSYGGGLET